VTGYFGVPNIILSALLAKAMIIVTAQVPNIHQKVGQDIQVRSRNSKSKTQTINAANKIEGKNTTKRTQRARGMVPRVFIQFNKEDIMAFV
jgi:RecA-family ATPase|tara:strand:- start:7 stop:279 length:273 start_codon:yes stop_codon:yes gene_type:complete